MGMYTWLNDNEFEIYKKLSDDALNEVYQEVRNIFPRVFINERKFVKKKWLGKEEVKFEYTVYVRTSSNDNEVRVMNMSFSDRELVMNFLYGLLNGHHWTIESKKRKKKK